MDNLIQKIIDGEHILTEDDFVLNPKLGGNIDVMEIAVDENPDFIKYATIEYKRNLFNNERIDKSTIDIYEYALKRGYVPKGIDFERNPILKKQNCIKEKVLKEIDTLILKLQNTDYKISLEDVENYSLIIKNVLPEYKEMFFNMVLPQNHRFVKFLDISVFNKIVDERIILNIIQNGYVPLEEDFINNKNLGFLYNMMKRAVEVNPSFIRYILLEESNNSAIGLNYFKNIELFEKALSGGFVPQEEELKNNYYLSSSKVMMKRAIDVDASYLKYTKVYDEELINIAIQNGYVLTEEDIKSNPKLLTSNSLMKKAIDIDCRYLLISNKNFGVNFEKINVDTVKYAIDKGYFPTKEEVSKNYIWKKNNDIMRVLIGVNSDLVELADDYEGLFDFAIANSYNPSFVGIRNNINLLKSSKLCNYLLKNDVMLCDNGFLNEYIKRDNVKGITLEFINQIWDFINNNVVYENMNYNEMLTIIKYVYGEISYDERYNELKGQLNELIESNKFDVFNKLINILMDNNNPDTKYKLNLMNDIIDKFNIYYNLCCSFVSSNYTKKDVYLLRYLLLSNDYIDAKIESIDDLKKYDDMLYRSRESKINGVTSDWATGEYDPYDFYDIILLMFFNMSYDEYLSKIHNGFSSKNIDVLIKNINDQRVKEELVRYRAVIKFIESIINVKDGNKLKLFAQRINEAVYKNSEAVIDIYNILRNMESIKKYYYGVEMSEKLLNISELEVTSDRILENELEREKQLYIRENGKYVCPDVEIHGRKLIGQKVDYVELNGMDFTLFVHVLNAYGAGGTLEDFKRSRLIGKTYICVSPITDKYYSGIAESYDVKDDFIEEYEDIDEDDEDLLLDISIENADNVKLVFSNVSPEQLVAMGNDDLWSYANDNSLEITLDRGERYDSIRNNVDSLNKDGYCEYVLYREDNNGRVIYPTAILSVENEPSQSEIIASAYLQIPILHINDKYLDRLKENQDISNLQLNKHTQLGSRDEKKKQLLEMKNILLNGFNNSEVTVISEGRRK